MVMSIIHEEKYIEAIIPAWNYYAEEILKKENEKIFHHCWNYVGLKKDLENDKDFITLEIGAISVAVQNFKGEIKAFHNVCTHRHNKIHTALKGNGAFTCQYHGWTYNEFGQPYGIPRKKEFEGLDDDVLQTLCLKEFKVDYCGNFVFVKISEDKKTLKEFIGKELFERLEYISTCIGEHIESNRINNKANWKSVVENTLEGYHINTVHKTTFMRLGLNNGSKVDFRMEGDHSDMLINTHPNHPQHLDDNKYYVLLKERKFKPDGFYHQLLFPNFLIGSAFGLTFYIGRIDVISPEESYFSYDLYEAALPDGKKLPYAGKVVLHSSSIEFTHTTLSEDKEIVENIQKVIRQKNGNGILSNMEQRVHEFQKAYIRYMES